MPGACPGKGRKVAQYSVAANGRRTGSPACGCRWCVRPRENPVNAAHVSTGREAGALSSQCVRIPVRRNGASGPARLTLRCGCLASFRTGTFEFFLR
ncbi:hypothetical protein C6Q28_00310 [Burkholderia multivorans]|nr:hypothetical protein C6Q28_00310 [Burkholderia multivorans]RSB75256.1 hypothetical protein EGT33_19910 [Burkholderia multivorans]